MLHKSCQGKELELIFKKALKVFFCKIYSTSIVVGRIGYVGSVSKQTLCNLLIQLSYHKCWKDQNHNEATCLQFTILEDLS